jgi:hypothetical protein
MSEPHVVVIDYGQTIKQMIEAGRYDYCKNITAKHFPIKGCGKVASPVVLVHVNRDISGEDALKEMAQLGLRPARIEHLLAYGALLWQRDPPIVPALGSLCTNAFGDPYVPCLDGRLDHRDLCLFCWDGDWDDRWHFLAISK